jgi:hypothetical protein
MTKSLVAINSLNSLSETDIRTKNVEEIAQLVCSAAKEISLQKSRIKEIEDRGIWDRMTSNNTRDIASVVFDVIELDRKILIIINRIIFINFKNREYLQKLERQILTLAKKMYLQNNEIIIESSNLIRNSNNNNYSNELTKTKTINYPIIILFIAVMFIILKLYGVINF